MFSEVILAKCFATSACHKLPVLNIFFLVMHTSTKAIHLPFAGLYQTEWDFSNTLLNKIQSCTFQSPSFTLQYTKPFDPSPSFMSTPIMSPDSSSLLSFTSLIHKTLVIVAQFESLPRSFSDHGHHLA